MKAIILNSGEGKRMEELTAKRPKCLVELNGETILSRQLRILYANGVKDVIITTGPFEKMLKEYATLHFPEINFTFIHNSEYESTNYIYSLYLTGQHVNNDILLLHGDLVFEDKLVQELVNSTEKNVVLINKSTKINEKDFKAQIQDNVVVEIGVGVRKDCYMLMPFYKLSKEAIGVWMKQIEKFVDGGKTDVYAENAFNDVYNDIKLKALYGESFCMEIDDETDLRKASEFVK